MKYGPEIDRWLIAVQAEYATLSYDHDYLENLERSAMETWYKSLTREQREILAQFAAYCNLEGLRDLALDEFGDLIDE